MEDMFDRLGGMLPESEFASTRLHGANVIHTVEFCACTHSCNYAAQQHTLTEMLARPALTIVMKWSQIVSYDQALCTEDHTHRCLNPTKLTAKPEGLKAVMGWFRRVSSSPKHCRGQALLVGDSSMHHKLTYISSESAERELEGCSQRVSCFADGCRAHHHAVSQHKDSQRVQG